MKKFRAWAIAMKTDAGWCLGEDLEAWDFMEIYPTKEDAMHSIAASKRHHPEDICKPVKIEVRPVGDAEIRRLRKIEEAWPIFMGLYESLLQTEKKMGCELAPVPIRNFMDFMEHGRRTKAREKKHETSR